MDLENDLKSYRYLDNYSAIIKTPDGGSLIYFLDNLPQRYKAYLVKTDKCMQIQWSKLIKPDDADNSFSFYGMYISEAKNSVILMSRGFKDKYIGRIFELDLNNGNISKTWEYPKGYKTYWMYNFRKKGDNLYFTNKHNRSFSRTDKDFIENLYCESRDTFIDNDNLSLSSDFYLTDSNAVNITEKYYSRNDSTLYYYFIEVMDLECNRIWNKRFITPYYGGRLKFEIGNNSIYIFRPYPHSQKIVLTIYDMRGNIIDIQDANGKKLYEYYKFKFNYNFEDETYWTIQNEPYIPQKLVIKKSFSKDTLEAIPFNEDIGRVIKMYSDGDSSFVFFSKKYDKYTTKFSVYTGKLKLNHATNQLEIDKCYEGENSTIEAQTSAKTPFEYYPNPARAKLTIKVKDRENRISNIEIVNTIGNFKKKYLGSFTEKTIDLSEYKAGMYILLVTMNDKTYHKNIIVL